MDDGRGVIVNEIQVVLEAFDALKGDADRAALATIVKVQGSAYRRPGARMLIAPDGRTVGSISAGCLDRDVCERAQKVIASGEPMVAVYDTTGAGDDVWGLGLGCAGLVEILIEPLGQGGPAHQVLRFLGERAARRDVGAVATVFRSPGPAGARVGSRLMLIEAGQAFCSVEDAGLAERLAAEAKQALRDGRARGTSLDAPGGAVEALIEVIWPSVPLVIFGAGDDAVPLARFAKAIGWHVTVVDSRPAFATSERFPGVDRVEVVRPEAVVMTHTYTHDLELLQTLLPSPVRYLGILGARHRTEAMLRALRGQGLPLSEDKFARVYSPIGMDIGAETPAEIALAILAEIKAVCSGRAAGFLRDRKAPIHDGAEAGIPLVNPMGRDRAAAPATERRRG
jgi:xanthine/CO dehydrogenase XdhC/CoxF family maturation factor